MSVAADCGLFFFFFFLPFFLPLLSPSPSPSALGGGTLRSSVAELGAFFATLVPQQLLVQRNSREEPGTAEVSLQSLAQKVTEGRGEASIEVPVAMPEVRPVVI